MKPDQLEKTKLIVGLVALLASALVIPIAGGFYLLKDGKPTTAPSETKTVPDKPKTIQLGDEVSLEEDGKAVFGAIDVVSYTDIMTRAEANDEIGMLKLIERKRVLVIQPGTQGKVTQLPDLGHKERYRVRILSGEHKGEEVYLPSIFVVGKK